MADIDPRKLAQQLAGLRAGESMLSSEDRVFYDPYAKLFIDDETQEQIKTTEKAINQIEIYNKLMPGVNGALAARIRFIDEYVIKCIKNDFRQMVIIGAGYDTRAFRIDGVKEKIVVFEVDHPMTQAVKTEKIIEEFDSLPEHVQYVPVIFGQDQLDQKLFQASFKDDLKTLFVIEGLLMYIHPQAVDGLLAFISSKSCPGSALVADYVSPSVINGTSEFEEASLMKQFAEKQGGVFMFGIESGKEEKFFNQRGFHKLDIVSTATCKEKYFKGESANRFVSSMFNFVTAVVAPK